MQGIVDDENNPDNSFFQDLKIAILKLLDMAIADLEKLESSQAETGQTSEQGEHEHWVVANTSMGVEEVTAGGQLAIGKIGPS